MTADVTGRLAEALCKVIGVDRADADESSLQEAVAALLPVVDEIARQRAADELEAAERHPRMPRNGANICRARAAALRGEGRG